MMQFEPFQDRLSRDIRNDLAATMSTMLDQMNTVAAREVADRYLDSDIGSCYRGYISDRLARYQTALELIRKGPDDDFWRALVLWDQKLFFEVHEVLEQEWYAATGDEKQVLQAMIRAAGVYIKLEYGYIEAAQKMADRALPVLMEQHDLLTSYFDPAELIAALQRLDLDPPRLLH